MVCYSSDVARGLSAAPQLRHEGLGWGWWGMRVCVCVGGGAGVSLNPARCCRRVLCAKADGDAVGEVFAITQEEDTRDGVVLRCSPGDELALVSFDGSRSPASATELPVTSLRPVETTPFPYFHVHLTRRHLGALFPFAVPSAPPSAGEGVGPRQVLLSRVWRAQGQQAALAAFMRLLLEVCAAVLTCAVVFPCIAVV